MLSAGLTWGRLSSLPYGRQAFGPALRTAGWKACPTRSLNKEKIMKNCLLFTAAAVLLGAGAATAANTVVVMETNKGTIKIELFDEKAPATVKNFLSYVDDKFYDGTIFHRVIDKFMIQGGGFEPGMKQKKTKDAIKNEAGLPNERGTLSMAR